MSCVLRPRSRFSVFVWVALVFCAAGSAYQRPGPALRDWTKYPAVVEVSTKEDIFAIGDAHADYERLLGVLAAAKLITARTANPDQVKWAAGKSVLVLTGDFIDKGHDALKVIALLMALRRAAVADGGRVIVTMGNHEAEFLAHPKGNKTKEFSDELGAAGLRPESVASCEGAVGQFLCTLPIAARVNDWFFSHGGNTNGRSIQGLNAAIEVGFKKSAFSTNDLIGDNSILEARLSEKGPAGLPWFDNGSFATDPRKLLTEFALALGVHHLVQGHQPGVVKFPDGQQRSREDMFQRYGLLFLIDTGMSRGIEGSTSSGGVLRIIGPHSDRAIALCANGEEKLLWDSQAQPDINSKHCGN